jgi:RNA polymerase sigma-70 factor (ECF subfamily)
MHPEHEPSMARASRRDLPRRLASRPRDADPQAGGTSISAEEALHDAFGARRGALARGGACPQILLAWLVSAGRFRAVDTLRRRARFDASLAELAQRIDAAAGSEADAESVEDDRLRLVFTCCHPALALEAQLALTLREVWRPDHGGRSRARSSCPLRRSRSASCAPRRACATSASHYQVPSRAELAPRLDAVLRVVYLVFNEGYSASSGESLTRSDLSVDALRLGRLLHELLPEPEVAGCSR